MALDPERENTSPPLAQDSVYQADAEQPQDPPADEPPAQDAAPAKAAEQKSDETPTPVQEMLIEVVGEKAERRLAARDKSERSLWFGLGAFGVIGWSIAIPTVIGIALGVWLDIVLPRLGFSWTLALLLAGLVFGCFTAWFWVSEEQTAIEDETRRRRPPRHDDDVR